MLHWLSEVLRLEERSSEQTLLLLQPAAETVEGSLLHPLLASTKSMSASVAVGSTLLSGIVPWQVVLLVPVSMSVCPPSSPRCTETLLFRAKLESTRNIYIYIYCTNQS